MTPEAAALHQARVNGARMVEANPGERKRKAKYGNQKTFVDGMVFASKREADRYAELKLLLAAGEITALRLQPCYPIVINGEKICDYYADFSYQRKDGVCVTEDTKGMRTVVYRIKKKLVRAVHGVVIHET